MLRYILIIGICLPFALSAQELSESERKELADIYLEQGVSEFQAGDYESAAQNYAASITYWGTSLAYANLCNLFLNGLGVPQDYERAGTLCEAAAALDDVNAITMLGDIHRFGLGVPEDLNVAVDYYSRGAEMGHPHAQYAYGLILFETDPEEARRLLEMSAASGYEAAAEALSQFQGETPNR